MQRLTAPIPRPRVHLLGFHDDVLAPNGMTRAQALQSVPAVRAEALQMAVCEPNCVYLRTVRIRRVQLFKRVIEVDLEHCANCGGDLKMRRLRVRSCFATYRDEKLVNDFFFFLTGYRLKPALAHVLHALLDINFIALSQHQSAGAERRGER